MDKALNYLSLARKAQRAELGEEPVGAAARALHAHLILVASDASDHTWRRAKSFAAGTDQQCVRLGYTKDELGAAIGRQSLAVAAITDAAMALAMLQSLPQTQQTMDAAAVLADKVKRQNQRQAESKAHQRNRRSGLKKK